MTRRPEVKTSPRIRPNAAALAWGTCALTLAAALALVILAIADPASSGPAHVGPTGPTAHDKVAGGYVPFAALAAIVFSAFAVVGAVVAARRPRNAVGWLFGAAALTWGLAVLVGGVYWSIAFGRPDPPALADWLAWFGNWNSIPGQVLLFTFVPLLFPTGSPPGPRWRAVGWTAAVAGAITVVSTALAPGPLVAADYPWIDNPIGIEGLGLGTVAQVTQGVALATGLPAIASLVVRYRRSSGVERLQLRWMAVAGCLLVLCAVGGGVASKWLGDGAGWGALLLGLLGLAGAVGVALLRYRLYDIDVVINRALVYATLTATLAGAYLGVVLLLQLALGGLTESSNLAVAGSTLAVAGLFRPARGRIQGTVDRRFYRRKYDAQRILARFGVTLRDEVALDSLSTELRGVVAETMQPAHVSLWLRETPR